MQTIDAASYAGRIREALKKVARVMCLRDPLTSGTPENLTPPQVHTLLLLGQEELSMSEAARRLNTTAGTLTGVIDRLEKLALVERQRDATDRRVIRLRLTAAGREMEGRVQDLIERRLHVILGLLEAPEQAALADIVEKLADRALAQAPATAVDDGTTK